MTDIEVTADFYAIQIRIDGMLHAHICRSKFLAMQAWTDHLFSYSIEFVCAGGNLVTEYTTRDRWSAILTELEKAL